MTMLRQLAFSVLLAISISGANAQDFDKGVAAYNAGDYQTALKEFLPLAKNGDSDAQEIIGQMYILGKGVTQSDAEAIKWYRLAADQGNSHAQGTVGFMYALGDGVIQNDFEALKWFRLAADQGYAVAQNEIGSLYQYGGPGIIQDNMKAHMWFNIASANGGENSAKRRDQMAQKMTREDISKAQEMAHDCISSGYKNCGE